MTQSLSLPFPVFTFKLHKNDMLGFSFIYFPGNVRILMIAYEYNKLGNAFLG